MQECLQRSGDGHLVHKRKSVSDNIGETRHRYITHTEASVLTVLLHVPTYSTTNHCTGIEFNLRSIRLINVWMTYGD